MRTQPSTTSSRVGSALDARAVESFEANTERGNTCFGVVQFRRDASGAIVPETPVSAPNGDIAWRRARAAAFDHDYVGAAVLSARSLTDSGEIAGATLLTSFGEVDLDALANLQRGR